MFVPASLNLNRVQLRAGLQLYKQWQQAAGIYQNFVPSAPFAALAKNPPSEPSPTPFLNQTDGLAQTLAALLAQSDDWVHVMTGQAAFILDLPGYLTPAVGFYLQQAAIAPVSLLAAYYQPQAILNGHYGLASLQHYGWRLQPCAIPTGHAFLLERERSLLIPNVVLTSSFDNRYFSGLAYFPPPAVLVANGLIALIDVRQSDEELPPDLAYFYQQAAAANLNIFQTRLPISDLPV